MVNAVPNFDNIAAATASLNTELPRLRNIEGIQGTQAILDELREIKTELRKNSNDFIRLQNS